MHSKENTIPKDPDREIVTSLQKSGTSNMRSVIITRVTTRRDGSETIINTMVSSRKRRAVILILTDIRGIKNLSITNAIMGTSISSIMGITIQEIGIIIAITGIITPKGTVTTELPIDTTITRVMVG